MQPNQLKYLPLDGDLIGDEKVRSASILFLVSSSRLGVASDISLGN